MFWAVRFDDPGLFESVNRLVMVISDDMRPDPSLSQ
jgi:hypothetical protein